MKFTDALTLQNPLISLEVIPPNRGGSIDKLFRSIEPLMTFQPQFINVTSHQSYVTYEKIDGVVQRISKNRKPGTVGVSAAIKHRFDIEPVPHIICGGQDKFQVEDTLIDLSYLGINNIFVIRGDATLGNRAFTPLEDGHTYAHQLVNQINQMNQGHYNPPLTEGIPSDFCIGVAGYPEKHFEALNFQRDLTYLKQKVDAGATHIITQMFFDIEAFRRFVTAAKAAGINVPIIPGIKPIVRYNFLKMIPRAFHINIPDQLIQAFENARTPKESFEAGTHFMAKMVQQLLDDGVPGIHLFTMGKGKSTKALLERVLG